MDFVPVLTSLASQIGQHKFKLYGTLLSVSVDAPSDFSKAVGLTLASGSPTYCRCPSPALFNYEIGLVLSALSDSCVCPGPNITDYSRQMNLVLSGSNDRCVCYSRQSQLIHQRQQHLK
jgi:hypothetical protein